jgi:hypothetical protein
MTICGCIFSGQKVSANSQNGVLQINSYVKKVPKHAFALLGPFLRMRKVSPKMQMPIWGPKRHQ